MTAVKIKQNGRDTLQTYFLKQDSHVRTLLDTLRTNEFSEADFLTQSPVTQPEMAENVVLKRKLMRVRVNKEDMVPLNRSIAGTPNAFQEVSQSRQFRAFQSMSGYNRRRTTARVSFNNGESPRKSEKVWSSYVFNRIETPLLEEKEVKEPSSIETKRQFWSKLASSLSKQKGGHSLLQTSSEFRTRVADTLAAWYSKEEGVLSQFCTLPSQKQTKLSRKETQLLSFRTLTEQWRGTLRDCGTISEPISRNISSLRMLSSAMQKGASRNIKV